MGEYIIELKEDPNDIRLLKIKNGEKWPQCEFKTVRPYTPPDIQKIEEDAYEKGYEEGYADSTCDNDDDDIPALRQAYKDGIADAWDVARKVYLPNGYEGATLHKFFHSACIDAIFGIQDVSETIPKIKAWEDEQKKIGIGDEVTFRNGEKGIVIAADDNLYRIINSKLMLENLTPDQVKKTGCHWDDLATAMKNIREV